MENEVSGIAKLGIVLIALAVLIALGFGIFQISKGTANTGVNNVQSELDGVSSSSYTTYDQTVITGTMVKSAIDDFEGEQVAVLVSTTAWQNALTKASVATATTAVTDGLSGATFGTAYHTGDAAVNLPVVSVVADCTDATTNPTEKYLNYNALLGNTASGSTGVTTYQTYASGTNTVYMGVISFDSNCFRCVSGFAADSSGKGLYNNITGNIKKSGTTEYIPNGAKYQAYLIKDKSGTTLGVALKQINS
jgi:hypothetical protein